MLGTLNRIYIEEITRGLSQIARNAVLLIAEVPPLDKFAKPSEYPSEIRIEEEVLCNHLQTWHLTWARAERLLEENAKEMAAYITEVIGEDVSVHIERSLDRALALVRENRKKMTSDSFIKAVTERGIKITVVMVTN